MIALLSAAGNCGDEGSQMLWVLIKLSNELFFKKKHPIRHGRERCRQSSQGLEAENDTPGQHESDDPRRPMGFCLAL